MKWVKLGDYIRRIDERNKNQSVKIVMGLSVNKDWRIPTSKVDRDNLANYKIVRKNQFGFVQTTNNEKCLVVCLSQFDYPIVISSVNEVFEVKEVDKLDPAFLYLWFCRPEFDRYARFNSWGSAREIFTFEDMQQVEIPLPSIEEQRQIVAVWKGLKEIKEQNEKLVSMLSLLCQSYFDKIKHLDRQTDRLEYRYPLVEIGRFIQQRDERNINNKYGINEVRGISTDKIFIDTKANMDGVPLSSYKIVQERDFAFVPDTSRRGDKMSLAFNNSCTCIVSSISCVFGISDTDRLLPEFLYLWFCRPEFDRYARFNSWGSAREAFSFEDMKRVKIPLPPIEEQQQLVNLYNCAKEAKEIAKQAEEQLIKVCPALMRQVIGKA